MVLTTHLMDEAEVLCDRLAIVEKGKMRAIGTLGALKRAHGGGVLLDMNYSVGFSSAGAEVMVSGEGASLSSASSNAPGLALIPDDIADDAVRSKLEEVRSLVAMGVVKASVYELLLAEHQRNEPAESARAAEDETVSRGSVAIVHIVTRLFPGATHCEDDAFPGFARFRLPQATEISNAFAVMETYRKEIDSTRAAVQLEGGAGSSGSEETDVVVMIDDWAITQAGLDDIFTHVVEGAPSGESQEDDGSYVPAAVIAQIAEASEGGSLYTPPSARANVVIAAVDADVYKGRDDVDIL